MRCAILGVLLFALALSAQDSTTGKFPAKDSDIPGPFTTYVASGEKKKGKFHCLVTEFDLNPVVMVMVRGTEMSDVLKSLLRKVELAIELNPNSRLSSFFVFHTDKSKDLARDDDIREGLEKEIESINREPPLKHVVLALDVTERLRNYKADTADVVVLLYNRYRVVALHAMKMDDVTEEKRNQILREIAEGLGAARMK